MAPRPFWSGYLKLSLVTCPVEMTPATSLSARVRFHTLNRKTGNRVVSRYVDAETGREVPDKDQVRGYAVGENEYVMLEDEELEAVALETTRTLEIERFAPAASVGMLWRDRAHYLRPSEAVGLEAFSVIRDAMAAAEVVGLSRLVLYRRERPVMVAAHEPGMVVWTLRTRDQVREPDTVFAGIDDQKPPADRLKLARDLIESRLRDWGDDMLHDRVQAALLDIIAARKKQRGKAAKGRRGEADRKSADDDGKVVSIMDALRRSLAGEGKRKP